MMPGRPTYTSKVGNHPVMRLHGALVPLTDYLTLDADATAALAAEVLTEAQKRKFADRHDLDFAYSLPGVARFRCNIFQQRGSIGIVLRVIRMTVGSFDDLRLPPAIQQIAEIERGLVLVTGTTTSGAPIEGLPGLRALLLDDPERFPRTVTEKLLSYALGRRLEYYDRPAVRSIVREAAADGYRWSGLVRGIVRSPQFTMRAAPAASPTGRRAAVGEALRRPPDAGP